MNTVLPRALSCICVSWAAGSSTAAARDSASPTDAAHPWRGVLQTGLWARGVKEQLILHCHSCPPGDRNFSCAAVSEGSSMSLLLERAKSFFSCAQGIICASLYSHIRVMISPALTPFTSLPTCTSIATPHLKLNCTCSTSVVTQLSLNCHYSCLFLI